MAAQKKMIREDPRTRGTTSRVYDLGEIKTFAPLSDRLLVMPDPPKGVSDGGIYVPDVALRRPHNVWGEVIAVGPGVSIIQGKLWRAGVRHCASGGGPLAGVLPGDRVLFDTQGTLRFLINGLEFTLIRDWQLLLRAEDAEAAQ